MTIELEGIGTGIAAVNVSLAVVLAVLGATGSGRLRKSQEWIERGLSVETDVNRTASLRDQARRIHARLLAREQVPPIVFAELIVWTLLVSVLVAATSPLTIAVGLVALWLTARRAVRLLTERIRVMADHYAGRRPVRARVGILHQMDGGTRSEFLWALSYAMGVVLVGHSIGTAITVGALWESFPWFLVTGLGLLSIVYGHFRGMYGRALAEPARSVDPDESPLGT